MNRSATLDPERCYAVATRNRLLAADLLDDLAPEQWQISSLCAGWTIREVATHLVPQPDKGGARLLGEVIRYRGNFDKMADASARRFPQAPSAEVVTALRGAAAVQLRPVGVGAAGPATDTVIHLLDMAVPLGQAITPDAESWQLALDFLTSRAARRGFVSAKRLAGLRLEATDSLWTWGPAYGDLITGTMQELAMAIAGRAALRTGPAEQASRP